MTTGSDSASGQLRGDINVTPLIDVLLVLLIIFMVIVPTIPRGLSAALPKHSANPSQKTGAPIVVELHRARSGLLTCTINQQQVSLDQLGVRLGAILAVRADKVIFLKGDDALEFASIAQVLDIAKGAGADRVGLLTTKDRL
ncbi:MAG TPA: biopolymer transporter ExbD [Terracidiphilus sp.]|nr:biopolymer transporter ExbD [Terracidiphilus sp.]